MSSSQFSRWLWVVLLVGCNAKLQVDPAASGGNGGAAGRGVVGTAGVPGAGAGPNDDQAGETARGGDFGNGGDDAGGVAGVFYPAGATGAAGSPVVMPVPGQHGQPCIPGASSVEADGTPAKTTITTLDRCNDGLACDATKHCTGAPICPEGSGPCVVHGAPLEDAGAGGSGGSGGTPPFSIAGANGGEQAPAVGAEVGVMALATDNTHLYWLEYGTRDGLGNYQHDGALFSYAFADSTTTTIVSNLPGPNALGITSGHAYVAVDGGPLIGSPAKAQVLRLPLAGGASELVQDNVSATSFTSFGDQAFWGTSSALYTVLPTAGANVSTLHTEGSGELAADATTIFANNGAFIFSVPQTGTTSTPLVGPGYTFALGGELLYGVEQLNNADGLILDSAPKTGGTWERKRALGFGDPADRLQVIGDRFFFSASPYNQGGDYSKEYIETGLISSSAAPLRLVEESGLGLSYSHRMLWTGTATAVFWSDGSAIFTRAITGS